MVPRRLGDAGESRLGGLEARHGAHVVEAVEHLVVEHQLRLVLRVRQVVPHVRTLTAQGHTFEITPLENVSPHLVEVTVKDNHQTKEEIMMSYRLRITIKLKRMSYRLSDMGTLNALSIVANNWSLCSEILFPLRPTAANACHIVDVILSRKSVFRGPLPV